MELLDNVHPIQIDTNHDFDSLKAGERVSSMWLALGEQIAAAVPCIIIDNDDAAKALRWATFAEACFWKATGEADTHDIKDVLGN